MIDQADNGVQIHGEGEVIARQGLAQDAKVVIVTQEVCQPVGVLDLPSDRWTAGRRDQPLLVPQILDQLAPRMQRVERGFAPSTLKRLTPVSEGAQQPTSDRAPPTPGQLPVID